MGNELFKNSKLDICPLVFPKDEEVEFTVKALGTRVKLEGDYRVCVHRLDAGSPMEEFYKSNSVEFNCKANGGGEIKFTFTASEECEHYVRIYDGDQKIAQLSIYALSEDLAGTIPLRGDFHVHTTGSDGRENPKTVCANYRRKGYDFIVITDHDRYFPSLEAIDFYKDLKIALNILPGEEVHLPGTPVHIVNAGGLFSVNGLLPMKENYIETNGDIFKRRFSEAVNPPNVYKMEDYWAEIKNIEDKLRSGDKPIPSDIDCTSYAVCLWVFDKIKKADGLSVFAHPYWLWDMWQIPEKFTRYMLENHPFDAFEVLGGENYYTQNGFQTALYYDEYRHGRVHPIVGSTDSHGSTSENRNWDICSTIVFARSNTREDIISAVKEKRSVAVDTISKEYRLVGEFRLIKYASFLMESYFPIHDKQAYLDGELTYRYAVGEATKEEVELISARADKLRLKYIRTK